MPPTPWSPGSRHTGPGLTDNLKSEFWQLRGAGGGKQRRLVPRPPPVCTAQTPTGAATADRPVALMFQLLPSPGLSPPRTPTLSPSQETSLRRTLPPPRPPAPMIRPALPSPPSPPPCLSLQHPARPPFPGYKYRRDSAGRPAGGSEDPVRQGFPGFPGGT